MAKKKKESTGEPSARRERRKANFTVFRRLEMDVPCVQQSGVENRVVLLPESDGHVSTQDALKWVGDNGNKFPKNTVFQIGDVQDPVQIEVETTVKMKVRAADLRTPAAEDKPTEGLTEETPTDG